MYINIIVFRLFKQRRTRYKSTNPTGGQNMFTGGARLFVPPPPGYGPKLNQLA